MTDSGTENLEGLLRRLEVLEAERDILHTMYDYAHSIDHGPALDWADCFTEDGIYQTTISDGVTRKIQGREALTEFAANHPRYPEKRYKHLVIAPTISVTAQEATALSYFARLDETPNGPVIDVFGRYRDRLVRCGDGRWRFKHRVSEVEGRAPWFKLESPMESS